jgi:hypothetical protein
MARVNVRQQVRSRVKEYMARQPLMTRPDRTKIRKAMRENDVFFMSLTTFLNGLGKEALGVMAAGSLDRAVRMFPAGGTVHDTGRAALNWDLQVGGNNPTGRGSSELNPSEGLAPAGDKGKVSKDAVPSIKAAAYGYSEKDYSLADNGWLHQALMIGKPGRPAVYLFNPILSKVVYRDGSGRTYAENAFPGMEAAIAGLNEKATGEAAKFVLNQVRQFNTTFRKARGMMQE